MATYQKLSAASGIVWYSDTIFAAHQLQEECQEQHQPLYMTFVDLTKAFDTVCHEGLWRIMEKFGCPAKFITMVRQFHDGVQARVLDNGNCSKAFLVTNCVKQGCVLVATLFSMMFTAMLSDAFYDHLSMCISYRYWTDGQLFSASRFQAKTKVEKDWVCDFLFADDCVLNAATEAKMQQSINKFATSCRDFGLTISTRKTEVMFMPAPQQLYLEARRDFGLTVSTRKTEVMFKPTPQQVYLEPCITVNRKTLKAAADFLYLGSLVSTAVIIDSEADKHITKASSTFRCLRASMLDRRGIKLKTRLKVYEATILPTLFYACETWTKYERHARKLNWFHISCFRKLLKLNWKDRVPDIDILEQAGMTSVCMLLQQAQLRCGGHIVHMPGTHLPKRMLFGELSNGKCPQGQPKLRLKDRLKVSLKNFDVDIKMWHGRSPSAKSSQTVACGTGLARGHSDNSQPVAGR